MGTQLDSCSCFKNSDEIGTETDISSDKKNKIHILKQPIRSSMMKRESIKTPSIGPELSKIISNNDYESIISENNDFKPLLKNGKSPEIFIQSFLRGVLYRIKFKKINGIKSELIEEKNEIIKSIEKNFIPKLILKSEKLFDKSNYEYNWKKYYDLKEISEFMPKIDDIILVKTECLLSNYKNEKCLYKGSLSLKSLQKNKNNNKTFNINSLTGKGVLYLRKGKKYEGNFINGKLCGWGRYVNIKGVCFEGLFIEGILNGKGEIIKIDDNRRKHIYRGDINNFLKEGKGEEKTSDFFYQGEYLKDLKHGQGKIFYYNNGDSYEGQFTYGAITGKGFYTWKNKHTYYGDFVQGKMHGKGLYKWTDGNQYEGDYINNIKEGQGEFKWNDGKVYKGTFENGRPHGKGLLTVKGVTFDAVFDNGSYLGDIHSGMNTPTSS